MDVDDRHLGALDDYDDDLLRVLPAHSSSRRQQSPPDVTPSASGGPPSLAAPSGERESARRPCCVCGDKASAYNFGVLTCDTCKAFFRRNATKLQQLKCVFNGNCTIDTITRKFCAACRLRKCFDVGMKPQLILDDERKKARLSRRNEKQQEKKLDKNGHATLSQTSLHQQSLAQHSPQPVQSVPCCTVYHQHNMTDLTAGQSRQYTTELGGLGDLCPNECLPDFACEPCRSSHLGSVAVAQDNPASAHLFSEMSGAGLASATSPVASFQHVSLSDLPSDMKQYCLLTTEERTLLTHLTNKYQQTMLQMCHRDPDQPVEVIRLLQMESYLRLLEKVFYHCVSFAKAVPEFRQLQQLDQIAALKGSAVQAYGVCASSFFVPERSVWRVFFGDLSVDHLPSDFHSTGLTREAGAMCAALKAVARNDLTLYALLHCLVLFDPREGALGNPQAINGARDRYLILLKHYLESEYSFLYADRYLSALLDRLVLLHDTSVSAASHFRQFSHLFQPLMAELFSSD